MYNPAGWLSSLTSPSRNSLLHSLCVRYLVFLLLNTAGTILLPDCCPSCAFWPGSSTPEAPSRLFPSLRCSHMWEISLLPSNSVSRACFPSPSTVSPLGTWCVSLLGFPFSQHSSLCGQGICIYQVHCCIPTTRHVVGVHRLSAHSPSGWKKGFSRMPCAGRGSASRAAVPWLARGQGSLCSWGRVLGSRRTLCCRPREWESGPGETGRKFGFPQRALSTCFLKAG